MLWDKVRKLNRYVATKYKNTIEIFVGMNRQSHRAKNYIGIIIKQINVLFYQHFSSTPSVVSN